MKMKTRLYWGSLLVSGLLSNPLLGEACRSGDGLTDAIPECTAENPCTDLLLTYGNQNPPVTQIDQAYVVPSCKTGPAGQNAGRPLYDDGAPQALALSSGTRYYCAYVPPTASAATKVPLLVFFHGSGGSAQNLYNLTSLRTKARPNGYAGTVFPNGFVVASVQARNLHWPTVNSKQDGSKWDTFYRDLSRNIDVEYLDALIDAQVASGVVDPSRIYLSGWSNGQRFAAFYGIHRSTTPTPQGNYVAAVASYSGGDPFENLDYGVTPSCKQSPYPVSDLPIFLVTRSCDAMACNQTQANWLQTLGMSVPPGNVMPVWMATLKQIGPAPTWRLIDDSGNNVSACAMTWGCGPGRALNNHVTWPDAIGNGSSKDLEKDMLDFLRKYSR